jgi:hypothetical protein
MAQQEPMNYNQRAFQPIVRARAACDLNGITAFMRSGKSEHLRPRRLATACVAITDQCDNDHSARELNAVTCDNAFSNKR